MSFQANPIACAAALESARLLEGNQSNLGHEDGSEFRQGNTWFMPEAYGGLGGVRASFLESDVRDVSMLPGVKGVMSLGSVLSVELKGNSPIAPSIPVAMAMAMENEKNEKNEKDSGKDGGNKENIIPQNNKNSRYYNSSASGVVVSLLKENNVYARPLGNVVYLMPTPMTPEVDRQRLIRVIKR